MSATALEGPDEDGPPDGGTGGPPTTAPGTVIQTPDSEPIPGPDSGDPERVEVCPDYGASAFRD